jgi:hypothetical protein
MIHANVIGNVQNGNVKGSNSRGSDEIPRFENKRLSFRVRLLASDFKAAISN